MYVIDMYKNPNAGTESQLYTLVANIDRSIFCPELAVFRDSEYLKTGDFPCAYTSLSIRSLISIRSLYKLINFSLKIRKNGFRLVHIFFNDASIMGPIIFRLLGLKVIISRRDMGFWYNRVNTFFLRINRFFVNGVVTNCEAVKLVTYKKERINPKKIHVIYNGYKDLSSPDANQNEPDDNILIELSKNKRIVGIVANIRPIKRIDDLVRAFSSIHKHIPDTHLVIIGSGDTSQLEKLAKSLNISDSIYFMGSRTETIRLISTFNVAVLCSESEGLSNAIIEYMIARVPVVCTNTGGNTELIVDKETGLLVNVGDIHGLANQIMAVLSGRVDIGRLVDNAYLKVTSLCNRDTMIQNHHSLYNSILEKR